LTFVALTTFLLVLTLIAAALLIWWGLRVRAHRNEANLADQLDTVTAWPPQATRVLTTAEREAYDLLRAALPAHMVLAQVPLQRFIKVPTRNSYSEWLRRAGHLSADLIVCDRHSQVVAVVEVHGSEPLSERAERRRERLVRVLKAADIPVHIWSTEQLPTVDAAREAIVPTPPAPETLPAIAAAASSSLPGRFAGAAPDDGAVREPPPSTWFDDLETSPAPLAPEPAKEPKESKSRPGR
jgi:hypothetical protein